MQTSAHDLLVMAHHDPQERLVCLQCRNAFIGEQGFAQLTVYKREGDEDWTHGYLIFCDTACALASVQPEGQC